MPEMTRDQLLANVYVLQPGDTLVVTCPEDTTPRMFEEFRDLLQDKLPTGVELLMVTEQISIAVARPVRTA